MSGFEGRMKEYRQVSIDRFDKSNLKSTVFFLSHCHRDHMVGLDLQSFQRCLKSRNEVFLYCSEVTKLLLLSEACFRPLAPFIRVLEVGVATTITIPDPDSAEYKSVAVTTLPAGHCPGSVMFLFEGKEGRVLYTGDFRWEKNYATTLPALCVNGHMKEIDSMYVDTTFCIPDAFHIPSRDDCLAATASLVVAWLRESPSRFVHVSSKTKYGHEPLLAHLAREASAKVHTSKEKAALYDQISELRGIYTADGSARIHACNWQSNRDQDSRLPCGYKPPKGSNSADSTSSSSTEVMVIRPSTMWFTAEPSRLQELVVPPASKRGMHRVCYSFHSSYSELRDLVSLLRPRRVYPNVLPASDTQWSQVRERLQKFLTYKHKHHTSPAGEPDEAKPLGLLKRKRQDTQNSLTDSEGLVFDSPVKEKRIKTADANQEETAPSSSQKSAASDLVSPAKSETHSSYRGSGAEEDDDMFADSSFEGDTTIPADRSQGEGTEMKDSKVMQESESLRSYVSGDEDVPEEDQASSPQFRHLTSKDDLALGDDEVGSQFHLSDEDEDETDGAEKEKNDAERDGSVVDKKIIVDKTDIIVDQNDSVVGKSDSIVNENGAEKDNNDVERDARIVAGKPGGTESSESTSEMPKQNAQTSACADDANTTTKDDAQTSEPNNPNSAAQPPSLSKVSSDTNSDKVITDGGISEQPESTSLVASDTEVPSSKPQVIMGHLARAPEDCGGNVLDLGLMSPAPTKGDMTDGHGGRSDDENSIKQEQLRSGTLNGASSGADNSECLTNIKKNFGVCGKPEEESDKTEEILTERAALHSQGFETVADTEFGFVCDDANDDIQIKTIERNFGVCSVAKQEENKNVSMSGGDSVTDCATGEQSSEPLVELTNKNASNDSEGRREQGLVSEAANCQGQNKVDESGMHKEQPLPVNSSDSHLADFGNEREKPSGDGICAKSGAEDDEKTVDGKPVSLPSEQQPKEKAEPGKQNTQTSSSQGSDDVVISDSDSDPDCQITESFIKKRLHRDAGCVPRKPGLIGGFGKTSPKPCTVHRKPSFNSGPGTQDGHGNRIISVGSGTVHKATESPGKSPLKKPISTVSLAIHRLNERPAKSSRNQPYLGCCVGSTPRTSDAGCSGSKRGGNSDEDVSRLGLHDNKQELSSHASTSKDRTDTANNKTKEEVTTAACDLTGDDDTPAKEMSENSSRRNSTEMTVSETESHTEFENNEEGKHDDDKNSGEEEQDNQPSISSATPLKNDSPPRKDRTLLGILQEKDGNSVSPGDRLLQGMLQEKDGRSDSPDVILIDDDNDSVEDSSNSGGNSRSEAAAPNKRNDNPFSLKDRSSSSSLDRILSHYTPLTQLKVGDRKLLLTCGCTVVRRAADWQSGRGRFFHHCKPPGKQNFTPTRQTFHSQPVEVEIGGACTCHLPPPPGFSISHKKKRRSDSGQRSHHHSRSERSAHGESSAHGDGPSQGESSAHSEGSSKGDRSAKVERSAHVESSSQDEGSDSKRVSSIDCGSTDADMIDEETAANKSSEDETSQSSKAKDENNDTPGKNRKRKLERKTGLPSEVECAAESRQQKKTKLDSTTSAESTTTKESEKQKDGHSNMEADNLSNNQLSRSEEPGLAKAHSCDGDGSSTDVKTDKTPSSVLEEPEIAKTCSDDRDSTSIGVKTDKPSKNQSTLLEASALAETSSNNEDSNNTDVKNVSVLEEPELANNGNGKSTDIKTPEQSEEQTVVEKTLESRKLQKNSDDNEKPKEVEEEGNKDGKGEGLNEKPRGEVNKDGNGEAEEGRNTDLAGVEQDSKDFSENRNDHSDSTVPPENSGGSAGDAATKSADEDNADKIFTDGESKKTTTVEKETENTEKQMDSKNGGEEEKREIGHEDEENLGKIPHEDEIEEKSEIQKDEDDNHVDVDDGDNDDDIGDIDEDDDNHVDVGDDDDNNGDTNDEEDDDDYADDDSDATVPPESPRRGKGTVWGKDSVSSTSLPHTTSHSPLAVDSSSNSDSDSDGDCKITQASFNSNPELRRTHKPHCCLYRCQSSRSTMRPTSGHGQAAASDLRPVTTSDPRLANVLLRGESAAITSVRSFGQRPAVSFEDFKQRPVSLEDFGQRPVSLEDFEQESHHHARSVHSRGENVQECVLHQSGHFHSDHHHHHRASSSHSCAVHTGKSEGHLVQSSLVGHFQRSPGQVQRSQVQRSSPSQVQRLSPGQVHRSSPGKVYRSSPGQVQRLPGHVQRSPGQVQRSKCVVHAEGSGRGGHVHQERAKPHQSASAKAESDSNSNGSSKVIDLTEDDD